MFATNCRLLFGRLQVSNIKQKFQMTLSYRESRWNRPRLQPLISLLSTRYFCIAAALSNIAGIESAFCWIFFLALASNQGLDAPFVPHAASMSAELPMQGDGSTPAGRQFTTLLMAGVSIAAWYCCRRLRTTSGEGASRRYTFPPPQPEYLWQPTPAGAAIRPDHYTTPTKPAAPPLRNFQNSVTFSRISGPVLGSFFNGHSGPRVRALRSMPPRFTPVSNRQRYNETSSDP